MRLLDAVLGIQEVQLTFRTGDDQKSRLVLKTSILSISAYEIDFSKQQLRQLIHGEFTTTESATRQCEIDSKRNIFMDVDLMLAVALLNIIGAIGWSQTHYHWTGQQWHIFVFSDESRFTLLVSDIRVSE